LKREPIRDYQDGISSVGSYFHRRKDNLAIILGQWGKIIVNLMKELKIMEIEKGETSSCSEKPNRLIYQYRIAKIDSQIIS
jgi:hypothetical protein